MDEAHRLRDVLSLEERYVAPTHALLATFDGKGAGNVVQMCAQEEEKNGFGDQLPNPAITGQSYNLVKRGGVWGKAAQALLEFLQDGTGPALGSVLWRSWAWAPSAG